MDRQTTETVRRYLEALRQTAARSKFPPETNAQNPRPGGAPMPDDVPMPDDAALPKPRPEEAQAPAGASNAGCFSDGTFFESPPEAPPGGDPLQRFDAAPETFAEFAARCTAFGALRVEATAGRRTYPVAGARVVVFGRFSDGMRVFAEAETDESGVADGIRLPAPGRALSQQPSGEAPYAAYDVQATHPLYQGAQFLQVPVFAGVTSVQPVRFLPAVDAAGGLAHG